MRGPAWEIDRDWRVAARCPLGYARVAQDVRARADRILASLHPLEPEHVIAERVRDLLAATDASYHTAHARRERPAPTREDTR